jgi:hypothetical protein
MHVHTYVCIYVCMYVYMHAFACMHACMSMYVYYTSAHTHARTHARTHTHTQTHRPRPRPRSRPRPRHYLATERGHIPRHPLLASSTRPKNTPREPFPQALQQALRCSRCSYVAATTQFFNSPFRTVFVTFLFDQLQPRVLQCLSTSVRP